MVIWGLRADVTIPCAGPKEDGRRVCLRALGSNATSLTHDLHILNCLLTLNPVDPKALSLNPRS